MKQQAKQYAIHCHESTNHTYNGYPYQFHLQMCIDVAMKFIHLIPEPDRDDVLSAIWCHDVIEDCRQTYNDVKQATNHVVADIVYAVTNEKGKNRKERANDKYYQGIRAVQYATFVKLCDRIANVKYSVNTGSGMAEMYRKEHAYFVNRLYNKLYDEGYGVMFDYLEKTFIK